MRRRSWFILVAAALVLGVIAASLLKGSTAKTGEPAALGIHKIEHVIVIMQENRSFDHYFGTFPGADGIPKNVCLPDPQHGGCVKPFVTTPTPTSTRRTMRSRPGVMSTAARWTASSRRPRPSCRPRRRAAARSRPNVPRR